jgi:hypothetical protein
MDNYNDLKRNVEVYSLTAEDHVQIPMTQIARLDLRAITCSCKTQRKAETSKFGLYNTFSHKLTVKNQVREFIQNIPD